MSIAIIGGIDRLKRVYEERAKEMGCKVRIFSSYMPNMRMRLYNVDGIVIFTNTISHNAVKEAVTAGRTRNIPVFRSHSSSISGLQRCIVEMRTHYGQSIP